jgi:hypothetical protein
MGPWNQIPMDSLSQESAVSNVPHGRMSTGPNHATSQNAQITKMAQPGALLSWSVGGGGRRYLKEVS